MRAEVSVILDTAIVYILLRFLLISIEFSGKEMLDMNNKPGPVHKLS